MIRRLSRERLITSFKTALACLMGIFVGKIFHIAIPQWILITIVVVMATSIRIGGTIIKSYFRLLGTIIGALLAALALFFIGNHADVIHLLLIFLIGVFAYLASSPTDIAQFGLLGATTMVMILDVQAPTLKTAVDRTSEIFLGVLIAIIVSRFVFPQHAKKLLRASITHALQKFRVLFEFFISKELTPDAVKEQEKIENHMINDILKQSTLLQEAINEDPRVKKKRLIYQSIFLLERKLLRSIYMLRQTILSDSIQTQDFVKKKELVELLNHRILYLFDLLHSLSSQQTSIHSFPPRQEIYNVINKVIRFLFQSTEKACQIVHIYAFEFCLEHLVAVLYRLEKWLRKLDSRENLS
ncbi:FUSC family protein [Coxiella endosymbiont of Amblyomma americanum]|uniref:FUSC family protein n=1 Tax=Coxiella endosymbiont of Amblyomma americanum TaxID=325775 RepID=UPI001FE17E39|nr:FUSC family protein [Coxiella endosymbiont of Amblyomma americanum]